MLLIILPQSKIEIVHIHSSAPVLLHKVALYIVLSKLFSKTVILHIHASEFEQKCKSHKRWLRWLFKHVDLIICVSKDIENTIMKYKLSTKTKVLYNLIDKPISMAVSKNDAKVRFLFMGEIIVRKGIYDLIEVLGRHKSYFEGKMLLSVAGGGNTTRLLQLIQQYRIEGIVNYLGWLDSTEKAKAFSEADVFVLPSYSESFGLVNMEANSYGKPVLTTNVGGIPEIVCQGVNGVLIEPGNEEELFEKMKYLMENPDVRRKMGENGIKAASQFYPDVVESKLKAVYDSLLHHEVVSNSTNV